MNDAATIIAGIRDRLDPEDGASLIANACAMMLEHQKDLAQRSGLSTSTITEIKRGKRASNAQRSAIYWAVLERLA